MRRAKIVATIGPGSDAPGVLDELIAAGMDVARLNASHSSVSQLEQRAAAVREASERVGAPVAVMLDLAGPKVRIGPLVDGVHLNPGARFELVAEACVGDATMASVSYPDLASDVSVGDTLLLDDGRIELRVISSSRGRVVTRVEVGGELLAGKGVNAPGSTLRVDSITERDREAIAWGKRADVDFVALSFVRSAQEVVRLRELLAPARAAIVAKVEKHEALNGITPLVAASDAVMVARGDLGVETSPEAVPVYQRRIISACRLAGVPVIVATQMLESMTSSPRPTRAEASDVANAVFEGADAVMLSAETAVGEYPVESVATMARIVTRAEAELLDGSAPGRRSVSGTGDVTSAVSAAVCDLAEDLGVSAIVTATQSGATARAVARHRPHVPIVAVTPHADVARRLQLVWGVRAIVLELSTRTDLMLDDVLRAVVDAGYAGTGDRVAITAGVAARVPGATDFILVREVH